MPFLTLIRLCILPKDLNRDLPRMNPIRAEISETTDRRRRTAAAVTEVSAESEAVSHEEHSESQLEDFGGIALISFSSIPTERRRRCRRLNDVPLGTGGPRKAVKECCVGVRAGEASWENIYSCELPMCFPLLPIAHSSAIRLAFRGRNKPKSCINKCMDTCVFS